MLLGDTLVTALLVCDMLWLLVLSVASTVHASCDGIFSYDRRGAGNTWGRLNVRPPASYNGGNLEIALTMVVNTLLPKGLPMGIQLEGSANEAAQALPQGRSITYSVRLPSQNPLPVVKQITVNGHSICQETPSLHGSVTTITMKHALQLQPGEAAPSRTVYKPQAPPAAIQQGGYDVSDDGCDAFYTELPDQRVRVAVPTPSGRSGGDAVEIKVRFTSSRPLGNHQTGALNLEEPLDVVASRLRSGQQSAIKYIYSLPVELYDNPPRLIGLEINGNTLCRETTGGARSTFSHSHTIFPSGNTNGHVPENVTSRPYQTKPPEVPSNTALGTATTPLPNEGECGINLRNQLVRLGVDVKPGAWPWLAALYLRTTEGSILICGASLVTIKHVITATHCVYYDAQELLPRDISVVLGMHKADDFSPPVQSMHVARIAKHPKDDADIAVLELASPVQLSRRVKPVCAWGPATNLVGKSGTVVGWGMNEMGQRMTNVPRAAQVPVVSSETCRKTHPEFEEGITENNFCAGNRDGRGPCNGDSGGGLYFLERANGVARWVLRGVVSFSLSDNNMQCDLNHFVAYTNVTHIVPWLSQELRRT